MQASVQYLEDVINENQENYGQIVLFDEKSITYIHKLKQCVYDILRLQVSATKVSFVIKAVLSLVDLKLNKIPYVTSSAGFMPLWILPRLPNPVLKKQTEAEILDGEMTCYNKGYNDSDPGTCRLVRTVSKAFGVGFGGDEIK